MACERDLVRDIGGTYDTSGHMDSYILARERLSVSLEGLAKRSRRVWWSFVRGSREILSAPSLYIETSLKRSHRAMQNWPL